MCVLGLVDIIEYCGHVCVGVGGHYWVLWSCVCWGWWTLLSIVVMCVLGLVDIIEYCGHVCVGVGGHY